MLEPQAQSLSKPKWAGGERPRPRVEGRRNPALKGQESPYGDGTRVVPKKLGMRGMAARRLQKKG